MADISNIRHSLAHLLAAAVLEQYPDTKLAIGPVTDEGFYYDIQLTEGASLSPGDLSSLEARMKELVRGNLPFERIPSSVAEAREYFQNQPYKQELIDEIEAEGDDITLYKTGNFTDLCRGEHVENTSEINPDAFVLDRLAGAYWRGDENNAMLTRIYGLAFETPEELAAYQERREEAAKRDHRKIGKELDLFVFSDLVGSGLPLFTPKGTIVRDEIDRYSRELRRSRGFQDVWIPHITKTDLYKKSGHWDKFGDELFLVTSQETSDEFALKPMNCPHHTQIYAARPKSYRDLPVRYMNTTTVYRDEKTGELGGLSRVRSITQDDSHVFCTIEQIDEEYASIMEIVSGFYRTIGMEFRARLSFRDPQDTSGYLGDDALWENAQNALSVIAKNGSFEYFIAEGEAAFYGPKIDFMATDALGREHQVATAQLDFVQPKRFGLVYIDKDGAEKTPVMIHLAIAGSLERFLAVYIEHTAGAFPAWLAPVQVAVLPVAASHAEYALSVVKANTQAGLRVEYYEPDETLGKRIRAAKMQKIPYVLVVGDAEKDAHAVTVESRDRGKEGQKPLEEFKESLLSEIRERR